MTTIGNWRRWGESDQAGALNLSTPDTVLSALRLPGNGKVYSLAGSTTGTTLTVCSRPGARTLASITWPVS